MNHPLAISIAQAEDLLPLVELAFRCTKAMKEIGIDQWDELYPSQTDFELDIKSQTLYLVRREEWTVACAVLNTQQEPEYATVDWEYTLPPIGVVHRLMVDPKAQGEGIARLLMSFVEERAARLGLNSIRLDAFLKNPRALELYERLGYRTAGTVTFRKGIFRCFEKKLTQTKKE